MRIGISTWVWTSPTTDGALARLLPHAARLGYDAVEVPLEEPSRVDAARLRDLGAAHGLSLTACTVLGPGRDLLLPATRDAGAEHLRRCVESAAAFGAPVLAGPFYSAVGRCWRPAAGERRTLLRGLADTLRALGDHAARGGVRLAVEPLNRFESSFLNTTEQALELVGMVDHPAVGLGLDLFHMGIEEKDVAGALRAAGSALFHLQVAENDRGTPGTGSLPWAAVARALRDTGYRGAVVVETFPYDCAEIATAAAVWRPLAPAPDVLAREGLAFLRGLLGDAALCGPPPPAPVRTPA